MRAGSVPPRAAAASAGIVGRAGSGRRGRYGAGGRRPVQQQCPGSRALVAVQLHAPVPGLLEGEHHFPVLLNQLDPKHKLSALLDLWVGDVVTALDSGILGGSSGRWYFKGMAPDFIQWYPAIGLGATALN